MIALPIIWILFGVAAAMAAANKGRSGCGWFLLGVLLGPFGLIFALLAKPVIHSEEDASPVVSPPPSRSIDQETKKCPQCAEQIKLEALKCRFCGFDFNTGEVARQVSARQAEIDKEMSKLRAGNKQCPRCGQWDVYQAYLPDGGFGDWCPHCKKPAAVRQH
jgi:hypothetical protein